MKIEVKSIDPAALRYNTCGDWRFLPDGRLQVFVPEYGGRDDSAFLVALHEMVEAWACKIVGISDEEVSAWNINNPDLKESGNSEDAPHRRQHGIATRVEIEVCKHLGIDWQRHQQWVENSTKEVERSHAISVTPQITLYGSRYWSELHLFGLRHKGTDDTIWFEQWASALPFDECPCQEHFKKYVSENPPVWQNFFAWGVHLHNDVNDRIGKPTISVEKARELWEKRTF
jgi:hypothetical protein